MLLFLCQQTIKYKIGDIFLYMKKCTRCEKFLDDDQFYKRNKSKDGLSYYCRTCCKQQGYEYYHANPKLYNDRSHKNYRRLKVKDPDFNKKRYQNQQRSFHLKKNFGLSETDYQNLFILQNGVCAICQEPNKSKIHFAVDHNHVSGKIRGLLCYSCNTGLGKFKENVETMNRAIMYLKSQC